MRSMSSQVRLPVLIFLLLGLKLFPSFIESQTVCLSDDGYYTPNSTYHTNLRALLSYLSTNIGADGFYNDTLGQGSDIANAMVLCRADLQLHSCVNCLRNATERLFRACPNQRKASIFDDMCMVRYSHKPLEFSMQLDNRRGLCNHQKALGHGQILKELRTLLHKLGDQAASGDFVWKVGVGNVDASDFHRIYALVQCTPDISSEACKTCIMKLSANVLRNCGWRSGRSIAPSCNIRYESQAFYNETRIWELGLMPHSPPGSDDNNTNRLIIIAPVSVVVAILAIFIVIFLMRKIKQKSKKESQNVEEVTFIKSLLYDFAKIRAATDDFSEANKLGSGGFGAVYKGQLLNGQEIAVKRLAKDSAQGDLEFKNEVELLARLQHRNLVSLLGFSVEGTEKLLIYEFIQNGSLDRSIFDPTRRAILDWDRRFKIIEGIAKGLLYLHEESGLKIIHRDLKANNILLDRDGSPKIADFGMARLIVTDETHATTEKKVGTVGYMAPEYALKGQFSVKTDIYSFGVLILEMISGQKSNCFEDGENIEVEDLLSSAWRNWREGTPDNLVDLVLRGSSSDVPSEILKCIQIGLLCIQEKAYDRPTIALVLTMLSNSSITLPAPSEPAFYAPPSIYGSQSSEEI